MPQLKIQGKDVIRVVDAKVEIGHGDALEAKQIPTCQFVITLPLDHDTTIAEWALSPYGPARWKTVELNTQDRSGDVNHTWTLQKAYVHEYFEKEFEEGSGSENEAGNYVRLIIRGTLMHDGKPYDGKNILEVKAGKTEVKPS